MEEMTEWSMMTVGNCLEPITLRGTHKVLSRDYQSSGNYPIVDQGQNLVAGWTDDETGVVSSDLPVVVFGDHTRALKYVDFPFVRGADGTQVLKPKAGIDTLFFYYACRAIDLPSRGYNRHFRILKEREIPIPSLREQRGIAHVLRQIDNVLSLQDKQLRTLAELKRTAMRTLFTRGLRGEPQKETEIGLMPESWEVRQLGDLAKIAYGAQAAVANATDPAIGTLILTNANLDLEGHINLEKRRYYKVPEEQRGRLILCKGDVLFNWRSGSANHIGKTVLFDLDGEYTYSSFILRFRPHRLISNKYLFRWLTYLRVSGFFTSQRNVSSINSVYNASLSATIPIWFPDDNQQREIVSILDTIDRKIYLHRRKRAVLEDVFKALLYKLMTGEIPVEEFDLSTMSNKGTT